jgi:hypothetical protein
MRRASIQRQIAATGLLHQYASYGATPPVELGGGMGDATDLQFIFVPNGSYALRKQNDNPYAELTL